MKRIVVIVIGLLGLLFVLIVVVLQVFDLNRYKEGMIRYAREATGREIRIDKISLGFRPGLVLRLRGLEVLHDESAAGDPFVVVPRFDAKINLQRALFERKIAVDYAVFDSPVVRVFWGDMTHRVRAEGASPPAETSRAGIAGAVPSPRPFDAASRETQAMSSFLTKRILVEDGSLLMVYLGGGGINEIGVRNIDLELRDLSSGGKASFLGRSEVLESEEQNLEVSGVLGPLLPGDLFSGTEMDVRLDFDPVDFDRLKKTAPALKDLPLSGDAMRGDFHGKVSRLYFSRNGQFQGMDAEGDVHIRELRSDGLDKPFRDFSSRIEVKGKRARVRKSRVNLGEGTIAFALDVPDIVDARGNHLVAEMRRMELHDWFPVRAASDAMELYGTMRADLNVTFDGLLSGEIRRSLAGWGAFSLEGGKVKNFNILRRVIGKISEIPVIGFPIAQRIAERYRPFLVKDDMNIHLATGRFSVGQGRMDVSEIYLESDFFQAVAGGVITLEGEAHVPGQVYLSPELSREMISTLNDLVVFSDQHGRLIFPFTIVGHFPRFRIEMDTEYVVSRLLEVRAKKLIDRLVDKDKGSQKESGDIVDTLIEGFIR